jgi:EAL domain-containing protein (putative c-di-GMP-specific phosphodiesterase class I)
VLKQKMAWQSLGAAKMRLAVNLSVRQLCEESFLDSVQEILDELGFDPHQNALEFEVTESMVIDQLDTVRCSLTELKNMGIQIAVDDFGTGYASLSYLTRLPVQSVKIDRSFIERMSERESDRILAAAIVAMAQSIGLNVIAEGVETQEQLEMLKGFGCDEMQGFLYSMPLTADQVTALLKNYSNSRQLVG